MQDNYNVCSVCTKSVKKIKDNYERLLGDYIK